MGGPQFRSSFCLQIGINGIVCDFVSFVDRGRLRLPLVSVVGLLRCGEFELADPLHDTVKFPLETLIRTQLRSSCRQLGIGTVKMLLGGIVAASVEFSLPGLIFPFNMCDEFRYRIGFRLWRLAFLLGGWCRLNGFCSCRLCWLWSGYWSRTGFG